MQAEVEIDYEMKLDLQHLAATMKSALAGITYLNTRLAAGWKPNAAPPKPASELELAAARQNIEELTRQLDDFRRAGDARSMVAYERFLRVAEAKLANLLTPRVSTGIEEMVHQRTMLRLREAQQILASNQGPVCGGITCALERATGALASGGYNSAKYWIEDSLPFVEFCVAQAQ